MVQKKFFTEVVLLTKSYNLQDFKDWMHWHLDIIGFQRCHIFDNESSVDIKSVCDSYGDRVTYELIKGWPNQYALYNRYINNESPAWWVLPIDDDEFLYVSDKYNNNVNVFLLANSKAHPDWCKICVGWRNMFPTDFINERSNPHKILNATSWCNQASEIWQAGNRPVKTFVNMQCRFMWADKYGLHRTHDPFVLPYDVPGRTADGTIVCNSWQINPTPTNSDVILYHYQFVCNHEWIYKCTQRKSAATKKNWKNHPEKYGDLYDYKQYFQIDTRMVDLWNG